MIGTVLLIIFLFYSIMADTRERTFIMIKPDGVQRGLVGKLIKRFEQKGFKLVGLKFVWVSRNIFLFNAVPNYNLCSLLRTS